MMASEKLNETPDGFYEEGSPVAADLSPFFPPIRHRVRGQICTPKHSIGGELEVRLRHALDGPLLPEAQLRAIARGGDVVQGSGFGRQEFGSFQHILIGVFWWKSAFRTWKLRPEAAGDTRPLGDPLDRLSKLHAQ